MTVFNNIPITGVMIVNTVVNPFETLDVLVKEINEHEITKEALVLYEDNFEIGELCLSNTDFREDKSQEYQDLIEKLNSEVCGLFIDGQGQCSKLYYQAKRDTDYKLRIVERDSFGPLIVSFKHKDYNWVYYYG